MNICDRQRFAHIHEPTQDKEGDAEAVQHRMGVQNATARIPFEPKIRENNIDLY